MYLKRPKAATLLFLVLITFILGCVYFINILPDPAQVGLVSEVLIKNDTTQDLPWGPMGRVYVKNLKVVGYKENEGTASVSTKFLRLGRASNLTFSAVAQYAIGNNDYHIGLSKNLPIKTGDNIDVVFYYFTRGESISPSEINVKLVDFMNASHNSSPINLKNIQSSWSRINEQLSTHQVDEIFKSSKINLSPDQFYLAAVLKSK